MDALRVWAPTADTVQVRLERGTRQLERAEGGWWELPEGLAAGTDYQLTVDDSKPMPDPRSPWQPEGVHGPSRTVDHRAFAWHDQGWQPPALELGVIYELHVGTFTQAGTFAAAIARLDHLVELGITHVEIMPVNEFSGDRGWGYDGVDLYAPHHSYGGPQGLKALVDACHARGLGVLLDVVYNHLGPAGNYLGAFGPYFSERYQTPWGKPVNLDGPDSDQVRRFFCDNALMWLRDYHCDGLRIDAVHALFDMGAVHFLEQLAAEVAELAEHLGRRLVLIPESDLNDPRLLRGREQGGYGLDAQWSDDFHHALHAFMTGERVGIYGDFGALGDLAKALTETWVYDGRYSQFRRRNHGRPRAGLEGNRFVGFLQNHDQIGNRPRGERSSELLSHGQLKIGAALVLAGPFIPMLFQGEEWGASTPFQFFTGHEDAELAQRVREGRSQEFPAWGFRPDEVPDPNAEVAFLRSKLNWAELTDGVHAELLDWHRRLIALRKREPDLGQGSLADLQVDYDEKAGWLVVRRGSILVGCNFARERQTVPGAGADLALLLASDPVPVSSGTLELPAESVAILKTLQV